jgi:hypothetical protein
MKRILIAISLVFITCLMPFTFVKGQEKKTEKKIKIIVSDNSGTKIIVDTLISDGSMNDSIKLKNGEVIYLNHSGDGDMVKHHGKAEKIYVTVSSEGKENEKEENEMDKKLDVYIDSDNESAVEKTRYIIAKDGMVVTVESSDEAKAKELITEIEKKLGVKDEGTEKKEIVKSESKKSVKK